MASCLINPDLDTDATMTATSPGSGAADGASRSNQPNAKELSVFAVANLMANVSAELFEGMMQSILLNNFCQDSNSHLSQLSAQASNAASQASIQNLQSQAEKTNKQHTWGIVAKVFGDLAIILTSAITIASGGVFSGLAVLTIGLLCATGSFSDTGFIGKELDKIADDISNKLGLSDNNIMRSIVKVSTILVLSLATAGTSCFDEAGARAINKLFGGVAKEAEVATTSVAGASKTLFQKCKSGLKAVLTNRPLVTGVIVGTQVASSSNAIYNTCMAIVDGMPSISQDKKKEVAEILTLVLTIAMMTGTCVLTIGSAIANIGEKSTSIACISSKLRKGVSVALAVAQIFAAVSSIGLGVTTIEIGSLLLKQAEIKQALQLAQAEAQAATQFTKQDSEYGSSAVQAEELWSEFLTQDGAAMRGLSQAMLDARV